MKIDKWVEYTAQCDECTWRHRDTSGQIFSSRKQAEKAARGDGWRVFKGVTVCASCLERRGQLK